LYTKIRNTYNVTNDIYCLYIVTDAYYNISNTLLLLEHFILRKILMNEYKIKCNSLFFAERIINQPNKSVKGKYWSIVHCCHIEFNKFWFVVGMYLWYCTILNYMYILKTTLNNVIYFLILFVKKYENNTIFMASRKKN